MSDRNPMGAETPSGAVQPIPGGSAVPAQPRKQTTRTSKSKNNDAQLEKKPENGRLNSSGFDASRNLNNNKSDDANKSGRGGGGGGGAAAAAGGGGCSDSGGGGKTPLIQVTRASCIIDAETVLPGTLERSAHTKDQPHVGHIARHVDDTTAKAAKGKEDGAVSETMTEAPMLASPSSITDATNSSVSLQRHHQQQQNQQQMAHPMFPGVLIVLISSLLVALGLVFIAVRLMVFGFCLVIFGTLLLLCGSLYLVHCCLETFRAKRQENFRAMALGRRSTWLTKPPPIRRSMNRQVKRRSSIAISYASDEKVEAIEDLNTTVN